MVYQTPHEALKSVWGYENFRPLQEDIIKSVLDGKDTLAILPTGGGKSICYQVPALCMEGLCIVITPLIALMKDQVDQLREKNISAYAVHSGITRREIDNALDNCIYGQAKFLYVSPERLKTEIFTERVKKMKVNLVAVDEAHCISQWGYDFRPAYLEIAGLRETLPRNNLIALTATATIPVRKDIMRHLSFKDGHREFTQSFFRPNLSYVVRKSEDKEKKLIDLLKKVRGTSIVYTRSRKNTKTISNLLTKNQISADYYHAGLTPAERNRKQERWMKNHTRVMVATNAFGMGINKPEVRLVIHLDLPDNIESYYQEAGRAGRDGKKAFAIIFYHQKDKEDLMRRITESLVDMPTIRKVYQSLANYYKIAAGSSELSSFAFDFDQWISTFKLEKLQAFNALKKLQEQGFILINDSFYHPSRAIFNVDKEALYKFQVANSRYEILIKTLQRIHGGEMFSNFVTISEKKLAGDLKIPVTEMEGLLGNLHQSDIITYDKQKDTPQVTFLTPRYDAGKLPINGRLLESRNNLEISQMESMISYLENKNQCRSLYLQGYFGESSDKNCGICDICAEKKKKGSEPAREKKVRERIIEILSGSPSRIDRLTDHFPESEKQVVILVIRQLLDSSEARYDELNYLHLINSRGE